MASEKKDRIFGYLALAAGIVMLLALLAVTVYAVNETADQYHRLFEPGIIVPQTVSISYSDHIFTEIGFGITRLNVDWYGAPGAGGFASGLVDKKAEAKKHGGTR